MNYPIHDIISLIDAQLLQGTGDSVISDLVYDSRKIINPDRTLFISINHASKRKGNDFLAEAYAKGVRNFLTDETPEALSSQTFLQANILLVSDSLQALQKLALHHRNLFVYPVIGITGSNGKTIIKEWLHQLLQNQYTIVRSPKSYNSQIGVPLSIWQMEAHHTLGIFEAGISQPGEMSKLEKIIHPEIGIMGYMGEAHADGFISMEEKINEKLRLFIRTHLLIFCADQPETAMAVQRFKQTTNPSLHLFSWGWDAQSALRILEKNITNCKTNILCKYQENNLEFMIPFTDEASIFNAMCCISSSLYLGLSKDQIQDGLSNLHPVEMRLELKQGKNNTLLINDSYSADLSSLQIALDFMNQQQLYTKRTVILSDFLHAGLDDITLYSQMANMLSNYSSLRLIAIGSTISKYQHLFTAIQDKIFFDSVDHFFQSFSSIKFEQETILIKGARMYRFEQIVSKLEQKMHETILEIDLNAIRQNLKFYRSHLNPGVRMMVMVKAFSYGSGSHEIAHLLQDEGVEYLAVAYTDEGAELRKAGVRLPIMVMNPGAGDFEAMVAHQLEPEIYSLHILAAFADFVKTHDIATYPVHIKLDTGMHRLGFEEKDMLILTDQLEKNPSLRIQSVFSHLVASENPQQDSYTIQQLDTFNVMCSELQAKTGYSFFKHICNTAGILRHPSLQLDMVRLGIGLYVSGNESKPVATLKTTIAQIKKLNKGQTVGYGRVGLIERDSIIATVRIGYADGYPRSVSNGKGYMKVNGFSARVIGNVCMDMTMIDITGINAAVGDEVIVFGQDPSIETIAKQADTISYEILTGISQRVKRVYFQE